MKIEFNHLNRILCIEMCKFDNDHDDNDGKKTRQHKQQLF